MKKFLFYLSIFSFLFFIYIYAIKSVTTASSKLISSKYVNKYTNFTSKFNFLNSLYPQNLAVSSVPKMKVVPVGSVAGLKLYTNGVLVVGMSEIQDVNNNKCKPYKNCKIQEGDRIISVNGYNIRNNEDLVKYVNDSNGNSIKLTFIHNKDTKECYITPVKTSENEYKLGLWVRDSAAGIGTVTFYEPESRAFGALGHGITDIDTDELINISSGKFVTTKILNIIKGEPDNPGRIQGTLENQSEIGEISKNTEFGIFGKVNNLSSLNIDLSKKMDIALRDEIKLGKATILCSLDNEKPQEYEIEIEKIFKNNNYDNKSMIIKVTDQRILDKTGGIIQGMSGSPIIQNGKFIGAVTYVLVSKPDMGYGVFADTMLKNASF